MAEPVLSILGLTKRFGAITACNDVSIELHAGQIHALIGPNGAGKTTLISQIAGNQTPDSGAIILDGDDISSLDVAGRARAGLARSFQVSSIAPNFTALQNVMLAVQGNSGNSYSFFKAALKDKSLVDPALGFLEKNRLQQRAHVLASQLSHGERRQLELAMALALKPKAYLLDEPMAGLGADGSKMLTKFLAELKHTAPILLVEHDMDAVFSLADRISVLVYGQVIASGTVAEIRGNPKVKEAYLGSDAQ